MEVIVLKYVQLVCITLFMKSSANCEQLMADSKDSSNIRISACAAECLNTNETFVS